jgi:hypothetical protein
MASPPRRPTSQGLFGAVVVLLGFLLLLDTIGVYPTGELVVYAPSLFALVGGWALVRSGFRNVVGPVLLVAVAGAWQAVALGYATAGQVAAFWPVLLIAFGLSVLLGRYRTRARATDDAHSSVFAAFSGAERRNTADAFTGADLTAVFGGVELDLRDAEVGEPPAHVNAVALFGGAEVIVPREWNVEMDVVPVLGGAADKRPRREERGGEIEMVVSGFAAFGGVSVSD